MKINVVELMKRIKKAWSVKEQWVSLYDDAYSLALPNRNTMTTTTSGEEKNVVVYDSTLQQCTTKLASLLQSTIVPPFTEWATLKPGIFITQDIEEAARKLTSINSAIMAAKDSSNFDTAVGEFLLDLCIGTGAMLLLEGNDDSPFEFTAVPLSEIALEDGPGSTIGAVFRKYKKAARIIPQIWKDAKPNADLSRFIMEDGSKEFTIHEVTFLDPDTKEWHYSVLIEKLQNKGTPTLYLERVYTTNPWIISRWVKVAGEVFGRGPVINALPDAKTLNEAKKLELQNASLAVAGSWLARNNGVMNGNKIQIKPGGVIPVQSTGGSMGADIVPLQVGGDINFSQIVQEQLRSSIKDAMFDRAIPNQGAVRSATEWIVRQQELQEAIGSPFGRFYQEFIIPVYKRMIAILQQKGVITEDIRVGGGVVDLQITGSLAQAQALKEVETITNWAQTSMAITGPEVFQATAKVEDINAKLADLMGIDPELVRTGEEKAQAMQVAQQQMMQQGGQPNDGQPQ
ncbi:MAG: hypothetical protein JRC87_11420 [Deltaproteobacteria bacterium]|nr:hypothetical protein [Deltaproteobacteria bacterium]